jgi:hypothetical protein
MRRQLTRTGQESPTSEQERVRSIHDRIQLGQGTTFLPREKDPSIQHHIDHVLQHGYVILPSIYTPSQVAAANTELARLEALDTAGPASRAGRNPFEGYNTRRIYALADKSRVFDCFPIHPTVLALNDYFLQPHYLMTSFHTVNIKPGAEPQSIHTDDGLIALPRPRPLMGIVCLYFLGDFMRNWILDIWLILNRFKLAGHDGFLG